MLSHLRQMVPLLPLDADTYKVLRWRRCKACLTVSAAMTKMLAGEHTVQY